MLTFHYVMLKQTREPHTENFIGLTENGKISIEDRKFGSYVILPTEINTKTKIIQIIGSIT